jgi:hypothetical protein
VGRVFPWRLSEMSMMGKIKKVNDNDKKLLRFFEYLVLYKKYITYGLFGRSFFGKMIVKEEEW